MATWGFCPPGRQHRAPAQDATTGELKAKQKTEGLDALCKFHFLFGYVHSGIGALEDGFYVSVG